MARKTRAQVPVAAPAPAVPKQLVQVKLLQSIAGPSGSWAVGETYRTDKSSAVRLIEAGIAAPIPADDVETRQANLLP